MTPVSTIVFFHAHPDDEASQTSGTMTMATARGDRVIVVFATNGEHGGVPDDLAPGETLAQRRREEAAASARVTGAEVHWLGYSDSGMTGWAANADPGCFAQADLDEAAARLAAVLDAVDADWLVTYDWHGNYGHPDHVQAHRVGHRAAKAAARPPRVLESTMSRDEMRRQLQMAAQMGLSGDFDMDPDRPMDDGNPMGTPESEITWCVDVGEQLAAKRAALEAHRSQVSDVGMMLAMPAEIFGIAFRYEYFIDPAAAGAGMTSGWPFDQPHEQGDVQR